MRSFAKCMAAFGAELGLRFGGGFEQQHERPRRASTENRKTAFPENRMNLRPSEPSDIREY